MAVFWVAGGSMVWLPTLAGWPQGTPDVKSDSAVVVIMDQCMWMVAVVDPTQCLAGCI